MEEWLSAACLRVRVGAEGPHDSWQGWGGPYAIHEISGAQSSAMARKSRYDIPKPTWTCPHCGRIHTAADLMRLDANRFQCKACDKPFPSGPADERR